MADSPKLTRGQRIRLALDHIDRAQRMMDRPHSPSGQAIRDSVAELRGLLDISEEHSWEARRTRLLLPGD